MAGYIGSKASVVSSGAERKKVFDITTTTTSLTGCSYTPNQVHVYHNGVRLVDGTDYTATDGSTVTLTTAAQSGDEVVVISYATFQTSDTVSASAGGTFTGDVTFSGAFTSQGIDDNADATAMTIDSSENVLIGTTSTTIVGSGGFAAKPQGSGVRLDISNSGGSAMLLDRRTNDGEIITFYKDGSTVGNIQSRAGAVSTIVLDPSATGGGISGGGGALYPTDHAGTLSDGALTLGDASYRWNNLYLSGGVYLGGTGAANYLDDYEEGTYSVYMFDAVSGGNFVSLGTGYYTKVGSIVHFHFAKSNINTSGLTGSNSAYFSAPFAAASNFGAPIAQVLFRDVNWAGSQTAVSSYLGASESNFRIYVQGDGQPYAALEVQEFSSGAADLYVSGTYRTDA